MTNEEKAVMEEWTVTQEESEAEMYANEKHCSKCPFISCCCESAIEDRCDAYRESYADYLSGIKAGKPKWHDLRKNPNDLPETSNWCHCVSIPVLNQDGIKVMYNYIRETWHFARRRNQYETCKVIAWCELPKFEEKK